MKKFYLILCFVFSLFSFGQIISFPDANFKAKLLQANVAYDYMNNSLAIDSNNDGEIEVSELQNVYWLNVSNSTISDLTGISNFAGLKFLICNDNSLTTISIDDSILLSGLYASHNLLSSINVNFDSTVESLDLSYNNFESLDLGNSYFADTFDLSHNQLTSLTLRNASFSFFTLDYNELNSIQFIGNIDFLWPFASFKNNQFTLLEFPTNVYFDNSVELRLGNNTVDNVYFNGNQPGNINYNSTNNTSFDLGNFNMSTSCDPEEQGNVAIMNSPNLENIIFKNGFNHTTITCNEGGTIFQNLALDLTIGSCPNLSHICVDTEEQPYFQGRINYLGLQSQVTVDTNCDSLVLGLETLTTAEPFILFPIPVSTVLHINSNNNLEIATIEIYNNLGQIVQKEMGNQLNFNVSQLAKGSYYLKIKTKESVYTKHFLKQ